MDNETTGLRKSSYKLNSKLTSQKITSIVPEKEINYLSKISTESTTTEKCWRFKYIFLPEAGLRVFWDILMLAIIIYQSLTIPFLICFDVNSTTTGSEVVELAMNSCFLLDILITFNTGFYSKGNLIMDRKEIIKSYIKFWFWLDLVASLPYDWFFGSFDGSSSGNVSSAPKLLRVLKIVRFLRILRLLRLAKLKKILMKIEDYISSNILATLFIFVKLIASVLFIAHWVACIWYMIGNQQSITHPVTWVTTQNLQNKSLYEKYITSLYWAFTTMSTVGYGDITPYTMLEKIYAMITMIMASGVFAFTIGSIGSLISKANAVEDAYREQVIAVNRYMRKKSLPSDVQFRVRRYLDYVWENKKKSKMDEKQILLLLSEPLRDEIYSHIHGVIINYCKIFEYFEANFISQLAKTLDNRTFAPEDVLFEEGEISNDMYFVTTGKVVVYHSQTKHKYQELGSESYFGEVSFFTQRPRCASVKCIDFADILKLNRMNFDILLEKFPEARKINEKIVNTCANDDYSILLINCYVCGEVGHVSIRCSSSLINLDQNETRNKWLGRNVITESKAVSNNSQSSPNYVRKRREYKIIPTQSKTLDLFVEKANNKFDF